MIKSIDASKGELIYETAYGDLTFTFAKIKKSPTWINDKIVVLSWEDEDGKNDASLASNAFLDNITHHLPHQRDNPRDTEQDIFIYRLYGLLNGRSNEELQGEIDNVMAQRVDLEDRKQTHLKKEQETIKEFVGKTQKVMQRTAVKNEMSHLLGDILEYVRIVEAYEKDQAIGLVRPDLGEREELKEIWGMFSDANQAILNTDIALNEAKKFNGYYTQMLEEHRKSLEVVEPEEKAQFESAIAFTEKMVNKYTSDIETLESQKDILKERRVDAEKSMVQKLMEMRITAQAKFEGLRDKLGKMEDYPDLGDRPEEMPKMDFVVSTEMKRMLRAARDKDVPEVTLKNMTPALAKSAMQSKLSKVKSNEN